MTEGQERGRNVRYVAAHYRRRARPRRPKIKIASGVALVLILAVTVLVAISHHPGRATSLRAGREHPSRTARSPHPGTATLAGPTPTSAAGTSGPATTGTAASPTTTAPASNRHRRPATFEGPDGVEARWVIDENKRPGTSAWRITGHQGPGGIAGYASLAQATQGQTVGLFVSTAAASWRVEAFRMGYYQGLGGRLIWRSPAVPGARQPACPVTATTNMVHCNWTVSLHFTVTSDWVQGEYLLKLTGSGGQQSYVPLTVWSPSSHAAYVIMDANLTTQAFNPYGGYDLYQGATPCALDVYPCSSRSLVVSLDRPYAYGYGQGAGTFMSLVYPLVRFAEEHGLDVTYWTDITLATHGQLLRHHKVLISTGHDEEWSLSMRNAALNATAHGVNLIFFGASPILRKVRMQSSPVGPDREMVNYRDPQADPLYGRDNAEVTQNNWAQSPADWAPSELVGATYVGYNNDQSFPLVDTDPSSWFWARTGLHAGSTIPDVLHGDLQEYQPGDGNPPGVEILAHSPVVVDINPEDHYADTAYYTMPASKAGVFESGTTQWIPALAPCPASVKSCPAPLLQKVTGNLLRVFGQGPVGVRHPSKANTAGLYG